MLRDAFPDAEHIHTRKGYSGVEKTPEVYLIEQLEKAGLEAYIVTRPKSRSLEERRFKDNAASPLQYSKYAINK